MAIHRWVIPAKIPKSCYNLDMEIKVTENGSEKLNDFYKREWATVDRKHYGKDVAWESWTQKNFTIEVWRDEEIVGALTFRINQDVSEIELFITAEKYRRQGIGTLLLEKLEEISKEHNVHKIYLQTGKDWDIVGYYEKFGYKKTADVPDHYLHVDYIEMTKFI